MKTRIGANTYDDDNLVAMFGKLDEKARRQAVRGGMRRASNKVRKAAQAGMASSVKGSTPGLRRSVWSKVYSRVAGFKVSVYPVRGTKKGYYRSSSPARDLPVARWLDLGTKERRRGSIKGGRRHGGRTGKLRPYAFMESTERKVAGSVSKEMQDEMRGYVIKTAKRYGCMI
jgi:hypothetical protein